MYVCMHHDLNIFILSTIETTLPCFDQSKKNHDCYTNVVSLLNAAAPFVPERIDK